MERQLDVAEKSNEDGGIDSTAYTAQFQTDHASPTKKGQRETIPILIKVLSKLSDQFSFLIILYQSHFNARVVLVRNCPFFLFELKTCILASLHTYGAAEVGPLFNMFIFLTKCKILY